MIKSTPINLGCDMAMGRIWSLSADEQLRIDNPILYRARQNAEQFNVDDIEEVESEKPF